MSEHKFEKKDYEGASPSTLCLGCGHDQISKQLVKAFYETGINPFQIAKISGIGCSSKTPNYFLRLAQGFNTLHGRMAPIATGVKAANRNLKVIGVSGDGDTGSIGLGSFLHSIKNNVPMIYIVENNGVYGLTKGQFSATAEEEGHVKHREKNPFPSLDLCRLALDAGCGFVARAFSGDGKQLTSLLKLALKYEGFSFLDVISPCVAYGNERDFPHSFPFMKEHKQVLHEIDIIEEKEPLQLKAGEQKIQLPNGSWLYLKSLKEENHNPEDEQQAVEILRKYSRKKETLTGLIYHKTKPTFLDKMQLTKTPLTQLKEEKFLPAPQDLEKIMKLFS